VVELQIARVQSSDTATGMVPPFLARAWVPLRTTGSDGRALWCAWQV